MIRSHRIRLLLLLFCVALVPARAALADDASHTGPYLGASGVYAIEDFRPSFGDSAGIAVTLGWRWNRWLATELRYEWLEGFDSTGAVAGITDPALNLPRGGVEIDTHQATINTKLFALEGPLSPYAVAGLGALIVNTELRAAKFSKPFRIDAGFAARLGAGVEMALGPHWVIDLQAAYLLGTGAVSRERHASVGLGLAYRF